MQSLKLLFTLTLITQLVGCATSNQAMGSFTQSKISPTEAKITFAGNGFNSRQAVSKSILYHCAKVTLQNGYQYFVITDSKLVPSANLYGNYNYYGNYNNMPGLAYDNFQSQEVLAQKYNTTVVIKMFNASNPLQIVNGYDANQLVKSGGQ